MITMINVVKKYPNGQTALNNLSFEVRTGEMVFLQGHSGAGKTTILNLLGMFERPTRGNVFVANENLNLISKKAIPYYRRHIGFISQTPKLLQELSVYENIALPLIIAGFHKRTMPNRIRAALHRVGLLHKDKAYPFQLSEGEKQRVNIARAIVHKPKILLADEPTGNLDPELSIDIFKLFGQFNQYGVTVLIASHDKNLIENLPYRSIYLAQGQLLPSKTDIQPSIKECFHAI